MIFIKVFQKLSQFSGKVPLEHWVSRIAINTCINQIQAEKVRPEFRQADLSEEKSRSCKTWRPPPRNSGRTTALPRAIWSSAPLALKPAERLVIDLLYLQKVGRGNPGNYRLERIARQGSRFPLPPENETADRSIQRRGEPMKDSDLQLDRLLRAAAVGGGVPFA